MAMSALCSFIGSLYCWISCLTENFQTTISLHFQMITLELRHWSSCMCFVDHYTYYWLVCVLTCSADWSVDLCHRTDWTFYLNLLCIIWHSWSTCIRLRLCHGKWRRLEIDFVCICSHVDHNQLTQLDNDTFVGLPKLQHLWVCVHLRVCACLSMH